MSEQKSNKVFTKSTGFRIIDGNRKTSDVTGDVMNLIQGDSLITNITLSVEQVGELLGKLDELLQSNPASGKVQLAMYTNIKNANGRDFFSSNIAVTEVKVKEQQQGGRSTYAPKQYGNKGSNAASDRASRVRREIGG